MPAAQYRMGCMCRDGVGCPVDVDRARSYFQLAADQNFSKAVVALSKLDNSKSAPQTPRSAISTDDGAQLKASMLESQSFQKLFKAEEILQSVHSIHQRYQQKIAEATRQFEEEIQSLEHVFAAAAGLDHVEPGADDRLALPLRVVDLTQVPHAERTAQPALIFGAPGRRYRPQ